MTSWNETRRGLLRRSAGLVTGGALLAGVGTQPAAAGHNVKTLASDWDTSSVDAYDGSLGVTATGPDPTATDSIQIGLTWGLGFEDRTGWYWTYSPNRPKFEFEAHQPDEVTVTEVAVYGQDGDNDVPDVLLYALDTAWAAAPTGPLPSPFGLAFETDDPNLGPRLESFEHDVGPSWDLSGASGMAGYTVAVNLATDGHASGTYDFTARCTCDVRRWPIDPRFASTVETLEAEANFSVTLDPDHEDADDGDDVDCTKYLPDDRSPNSTEFQQYQNCRDRYGD